MSQQCRNYDVAAAAAPPVFPPSHHPAPSLDGFGAKTVVLAVAPVAPVVVAQTRTSAPGICVRYGQ